MRASLASLLFCATLPLAAGFAYSSAHAQGLQYSGPGDAQGYSATQGGGMTGGAIPGDMTKMAQMDQQIRDLTNQLEQRDFQLRQLQTQFDKYKADTEMRLKALEVGGAGAAATAGAPVSAPMTSDTPPAPAPVQNGAAPTPGVSGGVTDPNGAFQPTATPNLGQLGNAPVTPNADGSITSGTPQGTATPGMSAAQAYDKAFSYLQQANYTDAQTAFSDFLKTYPTHALAANAQYWLGETYYAQTQYSTAAKTFAKSFQDHPNGQKAPDSLLKLAMTLDKMNKRSDACLTLGELTKRFPAGPASVLRSANEERTRMGCKA